MSGIFLFLNMRIENIGGDKVCRDSCQKLYFLGNILIQVVVPHLQSSELIK